MFRRCGWILIGTLLAVGQAPGQPEERLSWDSLPPLPPARGEPVQPGVAGAFVGVHEGALIVAGGTNFPDAPPWLGGAKAWRDEVYVLSEDSGVPSWNQVGYELSYNLATGAAVSTPEGVVMIGGENAEECFVDVYRLRWVPGRRGVDAEALPSLPRPLSEMGAALVGQTIYVVGGREAPGEEATTTFLSLDLSEEGSDDWSWRRLEPWPGPARVMPIVAAQIYGEETSLFVFSGRNTSPEAPTVPLRDGYRYDAASQSWSRTAGLTRSAMGAPAISWGAHHILVFGGDDGERFLEREALERRIVQGQGADEARAELTRSFEGHPGFSQDVLAYHTITDTWTRIGSIDAALSHVVTAAVNWGGGIVIPTGEVRPGVRTPEVLRARLGAGSQFGVANYGVLGVYLLALVGMGFYFARREQSADDFFRAGRRIPWWAAGISIFGTQLSAVTFMAVPAKAFATDWRFLALNVGIVAVAPLVVYVFVPFYRRLNVTTAYEYLEKRFDVTVRLVASGQFVLYQIGRIGIVLFLPSLALSVVTGIDVTLCILVMGVLCIFYTALGGIEAVIWTDVIQVVLLLGGALLCLVMIGLELPGGWREAAAAAEQADKLRTFDFRLDFTTATLWVLLFGGFGQSLVSYGTDQSVVQRYLTTKDEATACRGVWLNAIVTMPASLLFFALGTALYLFFRTRPDALSPAIDSPDAIFPWYIVTQLPDGVAGLLVGGLFAASMSSLDSSMNSVATAVTTDFYRRFRPGAGDRSVLNLARGVTVLVGTLGTALALLMVEWDIQSLWDQMGAVLGLFAGGLAGLFLLAMFTRRVGAGAALVALVASTGIQFWIREATTLHSWTLPITGVLSCLLLGWLLSAVMPNRKDVDGLTVHTLGR